MKPFKQIDAAASSLGSMCSAVLIAPDLVLTAAHCLNTNGCRDMKFVFGNTQARSRSSDPRSVHLPADSVYGCKKVEFNSPSTNLFTTASKISNPSETNLTFHTAHDVAVLRLDRPVMGISPIVSMRRSSTPPAMNERLFTIGHPAGLPQVVIESTVRSTWRSGEFSGIETNFNSYNGHSGGPVFSVRNGQPVLEGLYISESVTRH